jgi:hypothetical protein
MLQTIGDFSQLPTAQTGKLKRLIAGWHWPRIQIRLHQSIEKQQLCSPGRFMKHTKKLWNKQVVAQDLLRRRTPLKATQREQAISLLVATKQ